MENGARTIRSEVLRLDVRAESGELRFRDPATGQHLKSHAEAATSEVEATKALAEEKAARDEATTALRSAEARIAELEARLR